MSNLDMSLDDMIKMNKKSKGGRGEGGSNPNPNPRSRARNSGPGPARRSSNRSAGRSTPYTVGKVEAPDTKWGHDMFEGGADGYRGERLSSIETGTKLLISNLDYGVSSDDIKELFAEVGDIKRVMIHYDRSGRSKETAEVVYSRRRDAEVAVKKYNNVQLDGKPMKIEIVGTNARTAPATNIMYGNRNAAPRSGERRGGVIGRLRGSNPNPSTRGRGGGGGRGKGRADKVEVSAKDLDDDLEKYHANSNMQIN